MRKLATAALGISGAVFSAVYILPEKLLIPAGIVSLLCLLPGFIFRGNFRKRIFIFFAALSAGFIWCHIFNELHILPCRAIHEESLSVQAVVTDYPIERTPRGYRVDVKISALSHNKLPVKVRLYYYNEQELIPGDEVEFTAKFFSTSLNGDAERYDTLSSQGIFLSGTVSGDIEIIGRNSAFHYLPKQFARRITNNIDNIYPDDIVSFMKALLIGYRGDLYKDTALSSALSASGIIHIVAVSGMHISFLIGFLELVIKNRKLLALYAIPVLLFFMAMTGFSAAVTRAGTMQIFLIIAPLFKRERDSITSLSAAITILLMLNPYACAGIGLQLSFSSTLGIILFTSRINNASLEFLRSRKIKKHKIFKAVYNYVSSNLTATAGALVFSLPLMVIHFGYVSLISPLANLLTIGVVSLVFPLGILSGLLFMIHPLIAGIIALPVIPCVRYIIAVARLLATVPYSVAYLSNAHIMYWLLYVYVLFITLPLLKARFRQYLYPVCISIILLFAVILTSLLVPEVSSDFITVADVGQGLSVVMNFEGNTVVIDCGSISTNKAGEITHELLLEAGCTKIDLLAVTHFHDDHINGIEYLLSRMSVTSLALPDPEGSYAANDIIELARRRGTDIIYVTQTLVFTIGDTSIFIYPPLGDGDENERGISVLVTGNLNVLVTGDMNSTIERTLLRFAALPQLDILLAGHHGSRQSTSEELLNTLKPAAAIIPVGRNSFGHPHSETLRRLYKAGVAVYRTDEIGHITIYG